LAFAPVLLLGTFLGIRLARRVSESTFRLLTLIVVSATGLVAIGTGVGLL
jgi:uncharacterized membrane protein YfcA